MECKYCKREMNRSHRAYLANPFCSECLDDRLEASGAIDLRVNHTITILDNGYCKIEPIDPSKLFVKEVKHEQPRGHKRNVTELPQL